MEKPLQSQASRPNVVFILADDLGVHDLGATGSSFYETPNLDGLYSEAFNFTQGYATSRVCSPSRASILTGKFTARHGITDWIGAKSGEDWRTVNRHDLMLPASYNRELPQEEITLAEVFKAAGYTTFFAGKWHLGKEGSYPEDHGFDINVGGWEKGSPSGGYFSPWTNPKLPNLKAGENLSRRLARETSSFIKEHREEPFFAFLSFYAVHGPIQTSQNRWKKYRDKAVEMGVDSLGFTMNKKLPIRRNQDNPVYAGLIEQMDEAVGIVMQTLAENGLDNNTIVVFTSDNGGVASGDNFSTSNLPLRGGKGYQWEGGIREPYFIKIPWLEKRTITTAVTGADFYPTLLDLTDLPLNSEQHRDGLSLKPILEDENYTLSKRPLIWHYPHYGNQGGDPSSIIREENWKLIHYWEDDHNELYNLDTDPEEKKDLSSINTDIAERLWHELRNWLQEVEAQYPVKDSLYDPEKASLYMHKIKNELLPKLELERSAMYEDDFEPNPSWWDSKTTID